MANRTCALCGKSFTAQRSTAKYCGSGCRARASKGEGTPAALNMAAFGPDPESDEQYVTSTLLEATQRELTEAGVAETAVGQAAIVLAARICNPSEPIAGVVSASKQLPELMALAMKSVERSDPLDELRRRRDEKRVAG